MVTSRAQGPDHFDSSVTVDLPAGGSALITSPCAEAPLNEGKTLRSVLGPNVHLGLGSPSGATTGAEITVAFTSP